MASTFKLEDIGRRRQYKAAIDNFNKIKRAREADTTQRRHEFKSDIPTYFIT